MRVALPLLPFCNHIQCPSQLFFLVAWRVRLSEGLSIFVSVGLLVACDQQWLPRSFNSTRRNSLLTYGVYTYLNASVCQVREFCTPLLFPKLFIFLVGASLVGCSGLLDARSWNC